MDLMDIQAVESKLSDVTVTPIPRSQMQNFYNYQQQREQREQQPQIQISAIHHSRNGNGNGSGNSSANTATDYSSNSRMQQPQEADVLNALQFSQIQAHLALLQQQSNTTATPSSSKNFSSNSGGTNSSSSSSTLPSAINLINNGVSVSVIPSNGDNGMHTAAHSRYPQSTSPHLVTAQLSAHNSAALTSSSCGNNSLATNDGLTKYAQLLAVIEEMGRDIRPTYTGSRTSTERLKRGIMQARLLVRDCLSETERAGRQ